MPIYDEIFTFSNLFDAERNARKGKRHKKDVIEFENDLSSNLMALYRKLKSREYQVSGYNKFVITQPKKREIQSLHYYDRIVQHCLVDNYLMPILERRLIYDNAACRVKKGTDFARNRLKKFLRECSSKGKTYILQFDIHKYFESIDHDVLKAELRKTIEDEEMFSFLCKLIDSFNKETNKGLPMGNQTSQCFALLYLDGIDRLIKEKYQIEGYVRYMDDGVLVSNSLTKIKKCWEALNEELPKLSLYFNGKKTKIFSFEENITFLGFRFKPGKNGGVYLKLEKKKGRRTLRYLKKKKNVTSCKTCLSYLERAKERMIELEIIKMLKQFNS